MKELLIRGLFGAIIGVFIIFTIGFILMVFNGPSYDIASTFLIRQYISGFIIGFAFGVLNMLYVCEKLVIWKATLIHFFILTILFIVFGVYANWLENDLSQLGLAIGLFIGIYSIIWTISYLLYKNEIKTINEKLNRS